MKKGWNSIRIRVYGIVQGIGFRPYISRLASEYEISGDICNRGSYVEIHAAGREEMVSAFLEAIPERAPAVSAIVRIRTEEWAEGPGEEGFRILPSRFDAGEIFVSPDLATCPVCRRELFTPGDRRYLHPFINCTDCGPRLTILDSMPYDRERTSMAEFPMCGECAEEYASPSSRRFHAQPVCCPEDGPALYLAYDRSGEGARTHCPPFDAAPAAKSAGRDHRAGDDAVIRYVRKVLREGGIAAVKGIGGFHLACDACSESAAARLRSLKSRPAKPFAVMVRDLQTARKYACVPEEAEKLLDGVQKPILLLEKTGGGLAPSVAPDNPTVGVMLPYTPLHMLLFEYPDGEDFPDALIMTSGNPKGAPICRTTEEAVRYLAPLCDVILTHDRVIRTRADDTVMQLVDGAPYMVRRSRGYAPLPFTGPADWRGSVLAAGGELKNTFCLAKDELWYPSAYVGDLADLRAAEALEETAARMCRLLEVEPSLAVCDLHPGYNSTAYARSLGLPVLEVQHHYAHILSCMAENGVFEGEVIGVSFDGTGYGKDGTIWGGEFLRCSVSGFRRAGSIAPFRQAGGDTAVREGWRIALALLLDVCGSAEAALAKAEALGLSDSGPLKAQMMMLKGGWNSAESTSAGRLFDAVSALLGIRRFSTFEGEASMALEFEAEKWEKQLRKDEVFEQDASERDASERNASERDASERNASVWEVRPEMSEGGAFFRLETKPFIAHLLEGMEAGRSVPELAFGFHQWLARGIAEGCELIRRDSGLSAAALSGGVFQNLLLLKLTKQELERRGFRVLTHSLVPPNDGGICLGQALYGMAYLNRPGGTAGCMD